MDATTESGPTRDSMGDAKVLLDAVYSALDDEARNIIFTVGGKIDSTAKSDGSDCPLTIRWNQKGNGWNQGSRVSFPVSESDAPAFTRLVGDCQPATFGRFNKDVLDEDYRKASKIDETDFSTNFNPHEYDVINTIVQTLTDNSEDGEFRGIKAELYNLNVHHILPAC